MTFGRPLRYVPALLATLFVVGAALGVHADDRCGPGRRWSSTRRVCVREARPTSRPSRGSTPRSGAPRTGSSPSTGPAVAPALPACPAGQERSADTGDNCCWPGQVWVEMRGCVGRPRCPEGLEIDGDACIAACGPDQRRDGPMCVCTEGRYASHETQGHCCYPGQVWSTSRSRCVGTPGACPPRHVVDAEQETCRPAIDEAARAVACPAGMVGIPRTTFTMGSAEVGPAHSVTLSPYCISRTEVAVAEYQFCVFAGACTPPATGANWGVPGREAFPVDDIDWEQARAYCGFVGGRLPTEAEWELAARGADGRRYPWGNDLPSDVQLRWSGSCRRAACAGSSAMVGTHASTSPYGLFDAAGNVWEWTADYMGPYPTGAVVDPTGPATGSERVIRGGGWHDIDPTRVTATVRTGHNPRDRHFAIGVRCAANPGGG